ncbi:FkbM family methyltransferase [Candidatus Latescibacterota bacterium]
MNTQRIKSIFIKFFGGKIMAYVQALRFIYLLKTDRNPDPEIKFIHLFLNKGDIAVDIGANGADWTYHLHQCVGREGRVYAFEANPYYAMATDITIKLMRLKGVRFFPFGLSDKDECVVLRVTDSKGNRLSGQGYVDKNADINEKGIEVINLKRLDSLSPNYPEILNTALIKCDVEGFEIFVFKGANKIIENSRPIIILEVGNYEKHGYSSRDIFNFFVKMEYSPYAMVEGYSLLATNDLLEHDYTLSSNRILIPKEKINTIRNLIDISPYS